MKPNELREFVKQVTSKALKESDTLKEMWKDPNKAAQVRAKLEIMANDQEALKQLNNAYRVALEMEKHEHRISKSQQNE